MIKPFSAGDRDYIVARDLRVTPPGGTPSSPDTVEIALVAVGRRTTDSTTWYATTSRTVGPGLLLAGEAADGTGAVVLTQSMDAYVRCTLGGVTVVEELGRVPYRP